MNLTRRQQLSLARQIDGDRTADIAGDFGVTPSAIRKRRARAMKRLNPDQRENVQRYLRALNRGGRKHTLRPLQLSLAANI